MSQTLERVKAVVTSYQNGRKTMEQAITEAIVEARATCETNGDGSPECAVAWDIVEELQAERSHQAMAAKRLTSLEHYCELNPEAVECLIYDV